VVESAGADSIASSPGGELAANWRRR